jgi:L-asparaginase
LSESTRTRTDGGALPVVAILTCGGTISSNVVNGVVTPRLGAEALVESVPALARYATLDAHTVMTKPSPDVTLSDVLGLYDELLERSRAGVDGLVVTHGTDTLEEVAFALDLLWDEETPVVVTGAMRQSDAVGADGAANLLAAVQTAGAAESRGRGILVVFNDEIHSPWHVRKSHTSSTATFRSPTLGPIGYLAEGRPRLPLTSSRPVRLARPRSMDPAPRVPIVTMSIGDDGRVMDALASAELDGLVLAGFGGGHLPGEVARSRGLQQLLERVPVVLTSRAGAGEPLTATYSGFDGSETALLGRGLITSGPLDGPRSKVLLSWLLAGRATRPEIDATFAAAVPG